MFSPRKLNSDSQRFRTPALMIASGLLIEIVSLQWASPLAFVVFLSGSGLLLAVGILWYLLEVLKGKSSELPHS